MNQNSDIIQAPADFKPIAEPWFDENKEVVKVCHGFTCSRRKASGILKLLKTKFVGSPVQVVACPCTGNCRKSNNVVVGRNILHMQQPERVVDNVCRELDKQRHAKADANSDMSVEQADSILGL